MGGQTNFCRQPHLADWGADMALRLWWAGERCHTIAKILFRTQGFPSDSVRPSLTLRGTPYPLNSEMGWTGELLLKTNLLILQKEKNIAFILFNTHKK